MRIHLATLALAMLVGCGRNSGFLRDANTVNEHQFRMNVAAQRYARSASGSSSIGSILCIVPLSNGAYMQAMAALHAQAKLQTNEVLENMREDHAFASYLFFCEDSLIISADVYEVVPVAVPALGYAPPERASNFPTPASHPDASSASPPSSFVPPSPPIGEASARASDLETCERAYAHMSGDLPGLFRALYPKAKFIATPSHQTFLSVCAAQTDEVQVCLQAPFLKAHADQCLTKFTEMDPDGKARLFRTFLLDW